MRHPRVIIASAGLAAVTAAGGAAAVSAGGPAASHGLSASGNDTCRPVGRARLLACARAPGDRPEDAGRPHRR